MKQANRETWENFTCDKTLGRFTASGVDHVLEQVNKELKSIGGSKVMSDEEIDKVCHQQNEL